MHKKSITCQYSFLFHSPDPPKVLSIIPENTTLIEGSTRTFNCSYDANPAPNVTWGQNMSSIDTSDPNFNIVTEETYSLLNVTFANINYSGVYGCSIGNGIPPSDGSEGVNIIVQGMFMYPFVCIRTI